MCCNYLVVMFGGQMLNIVDPSSGMTYEFGQIPNALQSVRRMLKVEWADDLNRGFDFHIAMIQELESDSQTLSIFSL